MKVVRIIQGNLVRGKRIEPTELHEEYRNDFESMNVSIQDGLLLKDAEQLFPDGRFHTTCKYCIIKDNNLYGIVSPRKPKVNSTKTVYATR